MKKKWLKRKGCKNCALVWYEMPHWIDCDEDCEGHGEWMIEQYYKDKEFTYISKPDIFSKEITVIKNMYWDQNEKKFIELKNSDYKKVNL